MCLIEVDLPTPGQPKLLMYKYLLLARLYLYLVFILVLPFEPTLEIVPHNFLALYRTFGFYCIKAMLVLLYIHRCFPIVFCHNTVYKVQ